VIGKWIVARIVALFLLPMTGAVFPAQAQETSTFGYDTEGRLNQLSITGGPRNGQITQTCYDKANNRKIYSVGTAVPATCSAPAGPAFTGTMPPGSYLWPGQYMLSNDGRFKLVYQMDGNLVLYWGTSAMWSSGSAGTVPGSMTFNSGGTIYVSDAAGTTRYGSGSYPGAGSRLDMQNDGNLVVYRANGTSAWASNTCCH
jgi:hypothetical protein